MTTLHELLSAYAVPLQVWLTPEARKRAADILIAELQGTAVVNTNPLIAAEELEGPAVLVIAAAELEGRRADALRELSRRAHPGRAVLLGGTSDRDILMNAINNWGVIRVVSSDGSNEDIVRAVRAAGDHLKREVALESAIDDLDIETTMLESAIDHLDTGRHATIKRTEGHASNALAEGLAAALMHEREVVQNLATIHGGMDRSLRGVEAITALVEQTAVRAVERTAGLDHADEDIDSVVRSFVSIWEAQHDEELAGHIGTGSRASFDPLALSVYLCAVCAQPSGANPIRLDAHRSGLEAIITIEFSTIPALPPNLIAPEGLILKVEDPESTHMRIAIRLQDPDHG